MRNGFVFDMNKCVGCQACVVACQIENHFVQNEPWRSVLSSNSFQHPQLPFFYVSLACNHCEIPLCKESCPADAYTVDQTTRTIDHHPDRCIGCRYCTWACPYDAPKFISSRGVVEKCTLCKERIIGGKKPNCANLCPTGALDFGEIEEQVALSVPGFVDAGIHPGIKIIPLRTKRFKPESSGSLPEKETAVFKMLERSNRRKVTLGDEWPLVAFTVLASLLFGIMGARLLRPIPIDPVAFLAAGVIGMLLSTTHLGRKLRAWRALLNIRTSWLSREIVLYCAFLLASGFSLIAATGEEMRIGPIVVGLGMLMSIDMVYTVSSNKSLPGLFSASILMTGLLFLSLFSGLFWLFVLIAGLKFAMYAKEVLRAEYRSRRRLFISGFRILVGFFVPLLIGSDDMRLGGLAVLVGEVINRAEFYADLEILTPRAQIESDLFRRVP